MGPAGLRKTAAWDVGLMAWIDRRRGQAFAWGENDCAMLGFEAVDAMSGGGLAERFRGRWSDALSALRYQARHATNARQELLRAGCARAEAGFQQRGDLLVAPRDGFECVHVCTGPRSLSAWPELGVHWCETSAVLAAPGVVVLRLPG